MKRKASTPDLGPLILASLPALRAFARSLTGNASAADDLLQDTVVNALANTDKFDLRTSIRPWLFTILRNRFYSDMRRKKVAAIVVQSGDDLPDWPTPATQESGLMIADFRRLFMALPVQQREALALVGAAGLSYVEAARICKCGVGTLKSRVSRARAELRRNAGI